ncbi:hypothetical protein BWR17_19495 (plasmid) [Phaeobacter inhibens]|nr:hypothetical protein BWR17_19495 [Phaeobacter inhibens]
MIITTNLSFTEWPAVFGDPKVTTALQSPFRHRKIKTGGKEPLTQAKPSEHNYQVGQVSAEINTLTALARLAAGW